MTDLTDLPLVPSGFIDQMQFIAKAYFQATGQWRGCQWETQFGVGGLNLQGLRSDHAQLIANATAGQERENWRQAFQYLKTVENDALKAEQLAELAVKETLKGNWNLALKYTQDACCLEENYRPSVTWAPLREAILQCRSRSTGPREQTA